MEILLNIVFFDVLEILVSADFKFVGCGFIADHDAVAMELQAGNGPHLRDAAFDDGTEGAGLVMTIAKNHDFIGRHNSLHAYSESHAGYFVDVVVEETGVCHAGVVGEGFDTGA